jgi:hypothetical protein
MTEYFKQVLINQFEAALSMLNHGITACPPKHFEGKIASGTFRWVAYHTLFYVDLYLSTSEEAFQRREFHERGGDERGLALNDGLAQDEALAYLDVCRQKMHAAIAAETPESLAGPSGFSWYPITRGELHLNNIRHIQHHTGALYAYLRRVDKSFQEPVNPLPWIGSGWR